MYTDFYAQQPANKDAWGHAAYEEFIEQFFFTGMLGKGDNAIIDHITEITNNDRGIAGAWLHLIGDIHGGGVVGDNELHGRERQLQASWLRCNFDQLRNGMITKGRVAEMKSVIDARVAFRKKMARWLADSLEDQAILTASGISYAYNTDGSTRSTPAGQDPWTQLAYAGDVSAPTTNRHFNYVGTSKTLAAGDTTATLSTDTPAYELLPLIEAKMKEMRIPPIRINGEDFYLVLLHTQSMAKLWKDSNFRTAIANADVRGGDNMLFKNSRVTMNNLILRPYQRVYNTAGAASGSKWGSGGTVDGTRMLGLGQQALGMVDLGAVGWEEDTRDFRARWALAVDKEVGFIKPKFLDSHTNTTEDYGVIAFDMAL